MQLYEDQTEFMEDIRGVYRSGIRRILGVAATGFGKSATMRHMLERTNKRTLILCHRENLREMLSQSLNMPHDVIGAKRGPMHEQIHVGMMQTVGKRLGGELPKYDWIISDEAHLAMCRTWRGILQAYPAAWQLGLSASPCRLDGQGLGAEYEKIVYGPPVRDLMARGRLVNCRVFAPPFRPEDDGASTIVGDAVQHYRRLASGRLALAFCSSHEHAVQVEAAFNAAGIPAALVDRTVHPDEQKRRIAAARRREIMVLLTVDLLTTGFDFPELECGIMIRRTESVALFIQMVGRILRVAFGKRDAILIDMVGNTMLHGLPDEPREWTLEGREKKNLQRGTMIAQCPQCYSVFRPARSCPECGASMSTGSKRGMPKTVDGIVVEMDAARLAKDREAAKQARRAQQDPAEIKRMISAAFRAKTDAETFRQLDAVRKIMEYEPGWTRLQIVMRKRYRSKARARA